ncbi:MAG: methylmalonyl-CoA epimerase [Ardenticatenaceae bacterium]|nr:methylmalonyl-CoA epimerase [Ardenticatenaceae bacterium]MCB8974986.1 methylmalonyl-CoA epimerase [Ardenticatenaceae bacterium]
MIKKVNHIAVVVDNLEASMKFWVEALGLEMSHREHVASQAVDVAFLPIGDSKIELLQPTEDESGVAKYLQKRGPGMHHICFEVDDIDAALVRLKAVSVQLINEVPMVGSDGRKFAFIHPKAANGVLVELYELS